MPPPAESTHPDETSRKRGAAPPAYLAKRPSLEHVNNSSGANSVRAKGLLPRTASFQQPLGASSATRVNSSRTITRADTSKGRVASKGRVPSKCSTATKSGLSFDASAAERNASSDKLSEASCRDAPEPSLPELSSNAVFARVQIHRGTTFNAMPLVRHHMLDSNAPFRRNAGDAAVATSRLLRNMALLRKRANNARASGRSSPPCAEHLQRRDAGANGGEGAAKGGDALVEAVLRDHLAHATALTPGVGRPHTALELAHAYAEQHDIGLAVDGTGGGVGAATSARPQSAGAARRPHAGFFVSAHAPARAGDGGDGGEALRFVPSYEAALRRHLDSHRTPPPRHAPRGGGGYLMRKPPTVPRPAPAEPRSPSLSLPNKPSPERLPQGPSLDERLGGSLQRSPLDERLAAADDAHTVDQLLASL